MSLLQNDTGYYRLSQTLISGAIAGAVQSLAAAPIDAIVTRFSVSDMLESDHRSLWSYGWQKLREIGVSGVFAGFGISLIKESLAFSLYFTTFEFVKGAGYRTFVRHWYKDQNKDFKEIKPGRLVFPTFVLLAGSLSTFALQLVHYPLGKIQKLHFIRLEALDISNTAHIPSWRLYMSAYEKTFKQINKLIIKDASSSWFRWLYSGFFRSTLVALPSTSIGLVVFEIMRLRYSDETPVLEHDESIDYD
jgi:hypothetical protein